VYVAEGLEAKGKGSYRKVQGLRHGHSHEEVKEEMPIYTSSQSFGHSDASSDSTDEGMTNLQINFSGINMPLIPAERLKSRSKRDSTNPESGPRIINPSDKWMINPKSRFRMMWDIGIIMPFLVYLSVMMPYRMCFAKEAVLGSTVYWLEFMIDMFFLLDVIFSFRTGYFVVSSDTGGAEEEQEVEYDRWRVALVYFKSWFVLDVISGIPFALIELLVSSDPGALKSLKVLKILRFLKLGRLLKFEKIISNLDRDTIDYIADIMQKGSTRTFVVIMQLSFALCYSCHLMACGWVLVGRYCSDAGAPNWLEEEMKGPFVARDTTGATGEGNVSTIYISSMYFSLTTVTSVGYGDILAMNDAERVYVIFMEFTGAYIFAMIIGALTTVVTSIDINARNMAEQLDAVASFIEVRKFPNKLGRRVRRHFRQYYALKSAIDEAKIFSELSTPLRREVSEFLVKDLMGPDSFFVKMVPAAIWSQLLPVLRPMGFENEEVVCRQGEEASDFYVVVLGKCLGTIAVPGEAPPRERQITMGGSINQLYLMGVWHECLETVVCKSNVETYAVSAPAFAELFQGKAAEQTLRRMVEREVLNYRMDPWVDLDSGHGGGHGSIGGGSEDGGGPSGHTAAFGRPVHFVCFTTVELELLEVQGLVGRPPNLGESPRKDGDRGSAFSPRRRLAQPKAGNGGGSGAAGEDTPRGGKSRRGSYTAQEYLMTTELVELSTGLPFQERAWAHRTDREPFAPLDEADLLGDRPKEDDVGRAWEGIRAWLLTKGEVGRRKLTDHLRRMDTDGSGTLDEEEVLGALEMMQVEGASKKLAKAVLLSADGQGRGFLSLDEFVNGVLTADREDKQKAAKARRRRSNPGLRNSAARAAAGTPRGQVSTPRTPLVAGSGSGAADDGTVGGVVRFSASLRWMDVGVPFDLAGVRICLLRADRWGTGGQVVAGTVLPLRALLAPDPAHGGADDGFLRTWCELKTEDPLQLRLSGRPIPSLLLRARATAPDPKTQELPPKWGASLGRSLNNRSFEGDPDDGAVASSPSHSASLPSSIPTSRATTPPGPAERGGSLEAPSQAAAGKRASGRRSPPRRASSPRFALEKDKPVEGTDLDGGSGPRGSKMEPLAPLEDPRSSSATAAERVDSSASLLLSSASSRAIHRRPHRTYSDEELDASQFEREASHKTRGGASFGGGGGGTSTAGRPALGPESRRSTELVEPSSTSSAAGVPEGSRGFRPL